MRLKLIMSIDLRFCGIICLLICVNIPFISSRTILSVLSGREPYLSVLHKYIDRLVQQNLLDDVHLWDYTTNKKDKAYILYLVDSRIGYNYMPAERNRTFDISNPSFWNDYYTYYASDENLKDDDILIKCDDDIVYIDVSRFYNFLSVIRKSVVFVFPNVINNEIGALIQSIYKVHDLFSNKLMNSQLLIEGVGLNDHTVNDEVITTYFTAWHKDPHLATQVHKLFLSNPNLFRINTSEIILWKHHQPINFFGGMGSTIKKYYKKFVTIGGTHTAQKFLTGIGRKHMNGAMNKIVPSFVVSHFIFQEQMSGKELESLLVAYDSLATNLSSES